MNGPRVRKAARQAWTVFVPADVSHCRDKCQSVHPNSGMNPGINLWHVRNCTPWGGQIPSLLLKPAVISMIWWTFKGPTQVKPFYDSMGISRGIYMFQRHYFRHFAYQNVLLFHSHFHSYNQIQKVVWQTTCRTLTQVNRIRFKMQTLY